MKRFLLLLCVFWAVNSFAGEFAVMEDSTLQVTYTLVSARELEAACLFSEPPAQTDFPAQYYVVGRVRDKKSRGCVAYVNIRFWYPKWFFGSYFSTPKTEFNMINEEYIVIPVTEQLESLPPGFSVGKLKCRAYVMFRK